MTRRPHGLSAAALAAVWLMSSACAPATRVALPPMAPPVAAPPPPAFQRTFGDIAVGSNALGFHYKSLMLSADPSPDGVPEIKGAKPGHRTMLKSGNDFLFLSGVANPRSNSGHPLIAYLIEFDNGRNIFVSGDVAKSDDLREFVYSLRDDGKEIYAGFFTRRPGMNETALAQMIALVQPKNALIFQPDPSAPPLNEPALYQALKDELYDGPVLILRPGQTIPF